MLYVIFTPDRESEWFPFDNEFDGTLPRFRFRNNETIQRKFVHIITEPVDLEVYAGAFYLMSGSPENSVGMSARSGPIKVQVGQ
jgi:hypothetical protein